MNRINLLTKEQAPQASQALLSDVEKAFGRIPNVFKMMANAPSVLKSYLEFSSALKSQALNPRIAEKIAVATAQTNGCEYCLSVHSFLLAQMGASEDEIMAARNWICSDEKTQASLTLAKSILKNMGKVSDDEIENAKAKGLSEEEILEITANVTLNILTNSLNNVAQTKLDFPKVTEFKVWDK